MAVVFFVIKMFLYALCLLILLAVGAFLRLMVSRRKYEQKEIDTGRLRKGDVILTGSNKNISSFQIKISNILTNGIDSKYWTHAALHIGGGKLIEAEPKGIVYNSVGKYLKKGEVVKVYRNRYIGDEGIFDKVIDFCEEAKKEDYKYGWIGLIFYVLATFLPVSANFIFDNKLIDKWCNLDEAYFCSELIADAYKEAGHKITPFDSWRIKPSDFIKSPFFEEIY